MKMNFLVHSSLFFVFLAALAGCSQNPYPKSGKFFLEQPRPTDPAPVADIDMPPFLECDEGKACSAIIRGFFGDSGTPSFSFTTASDSVSTPAVGLPAGAVYDADKTTLTYTPDYGTVDTAKDPSRTYKVLNIEATLRKAEDPVTVVKRRNLLITVRNTPRPLDLQFPSVPTTANEGDLLHATLTVASADFPQGPFQILIKGAPSGVTAAAGTSPNLFEITYAIPYDAVSLNDTLNPTTGRYEKVYTIEYQIRIPSGETQSLTAALTVADTRIAPVVSYPPTLTQGPTTVDFTIRVDDLNGERAPEIHLPNTMPVGTLTLTEIPLTTPGIRAHLFDIRWTAIPATEIGKKFDFPFLVCGATSPTANTDCKNYVTAITIAKGFRR